MWSDVLPSFCSVRMKGLWSTSHLVRGAVLLTAAGAGLFVVLPRVHHLALGALPDQVSSHAGDILETMAWWRREEGRDVSMRNVYCVSLRSYSDINSTKIKGIEQIEFNQQDIRVKAQYSRLGQTVFVHRLHWEPLTTHSH